MSKVTKRVREVFGAGNQVRFARAKLVGFCRSRGFEFPNCPSNKVLLAAAKRLGWTPGAKGDAKPRVVAKLSRDFYNSPAWRAIRYQALKANDGRCELCGASKHDGVQLHVDHIAPRSKYPTLELEPSNLQVLCEACNMGKSNRDDTDWRSPVLGDEFEAIRERLGEG